MAAAPTIDFALFVTHIEGHIVRRYGAGSNIGVTRADKAQAKKIAVTARSGEKRERDISSPWSNDTSLVWDTETIVPIPRVEFERYRKEYTRALKEGGGLEAHSKEQWEAQHKARKAKAKEAADEAAAEAKSAATTTQA
jgi:hypothetical protein